MKILSPLAIYAENEDLDYDTIFNDVVKCVNEISIFAKNNFENFENDKVYIQRALYEVIADTFLNDCLLNDSISVDKHIDNAKKTIEGISNQQKDYNKNLMTLSLSSVFRVMNESYQFHNALYFSNKIKFSEVVKLNDIILNSALKNILGVLYLYEESSTNLSGDFKKEFLCESSKIASNIYADCLSSLFEKLSNEKDELKLYIKTPQKFVSKVENLFIEYFTKLKMGSEKIMEML